VVNLDFCNVIKLSLGHSCLEKSAQSLLSNR